MLDLFKQPVSPKKLFFANARLEPRRHDGRRVHIENRAAALERLGYTVFFPPGTDVDAGTVLPWDRGARMTKVAGCGVFYYRFDAAPIRTPLYARTLFGLQRRHRRVVWEFNAAPDLWQGGALRSVTGCSSIAAADRLFRQVRPRPNLAICNTEGLRRYALGLGIANAEAIPLGSNPNHFSPAGEVHVDLEPNPRELRVVWCGSGKIHWHDFESIVKAARLLHGSSAVRFYVVGEAPLGLTCPDNIVFFGQRTYEEMPAILRGMDVGLALYRKPDWSRFGVFSSPLKIWDYLNSGVPVICSPIELPDAVRSSPAVTIIDFENYIALADSLRSMEANRTQISALGSTARVVGERYSSWERVASDTDAALTELFQET